MELHTIIKFYILLGSVEFEDGEDKADIELVLPQFPLSELEEQVTLALDEPTGAPAKLGSERSCLITVKHDKGKETNIKAENYYFSFLKIYSSLVF